MCSRESVMADQPQHTFMILLVVYNHTCYRQLILQEFCPAKTCPCLDLKGSLSLIVRVDQWRTNQWALWLPTTVALASLSMEGVPGLVRVMGLGVGQLQFVKVSLYCSVLYCVGECFLIGGRNPELWVSILQNCHRLAQFSLLLIMDKSTAQVVTVQVV